MIGGVTFEKERHIYRNAEGEIVPSVSAILQLEYPPKIPWPKGAAQRGVRGHSATEYYDEGDLDEDTLDPDSAGYLAAWKLFRAESGFSPTMIEIMVYNPTQRYAGTIDRIGVFPNAKHPTVVDIKTGVKIFYHAYQTAAYAACLDEPHGRCCVYLNKNGTYRMESHTSRLDTQVWNACVLQYYVKKANGY